MTYDVTFDADIEARLVRGEYELVEVTGAPHDWDNPPSPVRPERIRFDGSRLVLPLGRADTRDGTYSTTEVATSRRFDQEHLDRALATGSDRIMVPGRQAVFRDVVFSPHFGDTRAARQTVTAGMCFQSWRGIERGIENSHRPLFMAATISYVGGAGLTAMLASRSRHRRVLTAAVTDFRTGLMWFTPLPGIDPTRPHDYVMRWHSNRDVEFLVDGSVVARREDGGRSVSLMKLFAGTRRGIDLIGHRYLTADPCHVDCWINCSKTGNRPGVAPGDRFSEDLWVALGGFAVEALEPGVP